MVWAGSSGASALCEGGQGTSACWSVDHAANVLRAAVVQPVGPGVEALYESAALRRFVGVAPAPDETTVSRFRHLLEQHHLGGLMLEAVNVHLGARGIRIQTSTIVDATIIHAPSSTKNEKQERDPEMHQARKGKQWCLGLKAHIGVDAKEGYVHPVATSAASVADCYMLPELLHGEERKVWATSAIKARPRRSKWPLRRPRT